MIAYRLHYEPFNRKVMELCAHKAFGPVKTFSSSNCQNVTAPNIRLSADLGGGPIGDVGIYSINAARYVTGEEPVEVTAMAHPPAQDPRFREVPESVAAGLLSVGRARALRLQLRLGGEPPLSGPLRRGGDRTWTRLSTTAVCALG